MILLYSFFKNYFACIKEIITGLYYNKMRFFYTILIYNDMLILSEELKTYFGF